VYKQGDPGQGIGGYDLLSTADRSFAFDYDHSGKLDHIVLYRPGGGAIFILKKGNGTFSPVYHQGEPGYGIGGYDLKSPADMAFAFDYEHSGKLDYIALYRPGTGTFWILKNDNGEFSAVYQQGDPGNGIGGYDFKSPKDHAFAFDYDHSGKLNHIAIYRPGTGTFWILKNNNGEFSAVYQQGDPGNGIGGYDLLSTADSAFAFDYDHSGKMDYVTLYRPGSGTIWILRHDGNDFIPVYQQDGPGNGIGGFGLASPIDSAFAFDLDSTGRQDNLVLYRPGTGIFWILKNSNGTFTPIYGQNNPGVGIGGYDLKSPQDLGYSLDYRRNGKLDHIVLYRPGTGAFFIVEKS
jgi:hypothetical protein